MKKLDTTSILVGAFNMIIFQKLDTLKYELKIEI